MIPMFGYKPVRVVVVAGIAALLSGCYYMQAARGQFEVMNKREPIDDVINATETPAGLSKRLELVKEARQFSVDELGLPDNESYRSYADIERDYVVWNVFAAPEFSLQAKTWCYPVAGCVGYRGYFSSDDAEGRAEKLRNDGYDVVVGGVSAYSTLGRFSDPVLNTMMRWSELDLVAVLFHELAHQQLYVKGDSGFNESFATAVEEIGVERWLESQGETDRLDEYRDSREFRQRLMQHVQSARKDLQALYESDMGEEDMRAGKEAILDELRDVAQAEVKASGRSSPGWLRSKLNNASLIPLSLYQGRLDEFRELVKACDDDLQCFYEQAEAFAKEK